MALIRVSDLPDAEECWYVPVRFVWVKVFGKIELWTAAEKPLLIQKMIGITNIKYK